MSVEAIVNAHLRGFINCEPNYRLINSCLHFWKQTGKLPMLTDIVTMCKQAKGKADQQLAASMLGYGHRADDPYVEGLYNLFLTKYIHSFGIYPSSTDTENSFAFFLHEKRFPNQVELAEIDFHLQEAADVHGAEEKKSSKKNDVSKLIALTTKVKKEDKLCAEECCICLERFKEGEKVTRLECKHIFHQGSVKIDTNKIKPEKIDTEKTTECGGITTWLLKNDYCPICNKKFY